MNFVALIAGFIVMIATTHSLGPLMAIIAGVIVGGVVRLLIYGFSSKGTAPTHHLQGAGSAQTVSEPTSAAEAKVRLDAVKKIPVSPKALPFLTDIIVGIEQGETQSHWQLGSCFLHGTVGLSYPFPKDKTKALFWFRRSAELGSASSQYHLALMYLGDTAWQLQLPYSEDNAIEKNFDEALYWLNKAANQTDTFSASAQDVLGEIYFLGIEVNQDHAKAFDLFSKAAANPRSFSNKFGVATRASERLPVLMAEGHV